MLSIIIEEILFQITIRSAKRVIFKFFSQLSFITRICALNLKSLKKGPCKKLQLDQLRFLYYITLHIYINLAEDRSILVEA